MTRKKCPCGTIPYFKFPGGKLIACSKCKKPGMEDTKHKRCQCGRSSSSFGYPGDKSPTCCSKCKKPGMKNITHKKCQCGTIPSFAYPGDKSPICCSKCQKPGMKDITNRVCPCGTRTRFGYPGEKTATCCSKCQKPGMEDIRSYRCPCGTMAYFGIPGGKPVACSKCRKPGMKDIRSKMCLCGTKCCFGFPGESPICCSKCKKPGMVDIRNKKCASNDRGIECPLWRNKKYDGYCTHCFANLFPEDPRTAKIRKKSKELQVKVFIEEHFSNFISDKPLYVDLEGGCCQSKRRIDLRKLINGTLLCIEVDEDQHKKYCKENEIFRYNDLFMDFSGHYIFIRFNPDKFRNGKGGNPRMETRLEALRKEVSGHIERIENGENTELIEIHHMYYDFEK